jgi:hypothetical protein
MKLPNFPAWFYSHIVHWMDLSVANGQRIVKNTVFTDEVHPVTETVNHSYSAVDVCRVLNEVWGFWEALEPVRWRGLSSDTESQLDTPLLDKAQILNVQIAKTIGDIVEYYAVRAQHLLISLSDHPNRKPLLSFYTRALHCSIARARRHG